MFPRVRPARGSLDWRLTVGFSACRNRSRPERTVSLVTLGCARNEVDSEELAARLEAAGWTLADRDSASVVLVNTCGFIEAAKQESVNELLDAADGGAKVVAAGCLAERYGDTLAAELPEAQVLSFDDYAEIGARLDEVLAGQRRPAHQPRDRRRLLPISPASRPGGAAARPPGHGDGTRTAAVQPGGGIRTCRPGPRPRPGRARCGAGWPRAGRPAQDRFRLRPAVQLLCHPVVPRRVPVPAA